MIAVLFLSFVCFNVLADESEAIKTTTKALLQVGSIKKVKKIVENKISNNIPIDVQIVGIAGTAGLNAATKGEVNTEHIKNLNIDVINGNFRSDVYYNFRNGVFNANINMNWDF